MKIGYTVVYSANMRRVYRDLLPVIGQARSENELQYLDFSPCQCS
jgi:hypothetical protein